MVSIEDLSRLLEDRPSSALWNLLWLLAAPLFWYMLRWFSSYAAEQQQQQQAEAELIAAARKAPLAAGGDAAGKPELTPQRVAELFKRYPAPWAIAGGWAVDLHLGRVTREHVDIEIAVLRRDQPALQEYLLGWQPQVVDVNLGGQRRPWLAHEQLELPLHELYADPPAWDVGPLELLLNEADGADWVYRRDPRLRLPLARAIRVSADGIPYLAPEVVLLYKSKQPRAQDELDFSAALPVLDGAQRQWLTGAIRLAHPDSPWAARLD